MALDLFFVPSKPGFSELGSADFKPTPSMLKARRKVVDALLEAFPGTQLQGEVTEGYIDGFPRGELTLQPGRIHWSLHHVDDVAPIHEVVDWFLAHGLVCEDMQDAGFGNRESRTVENDEPLESLDALVGAQLLGFRFDRNWSTAIMFEWTLADGRLVRMRFHHLGTCRLPDLTPLVAATVVEAHLESSTISHTLSVRFSDGSELTMFDAVFDKALVSTTRTRV